MQTTSNDSATRRHEPACPALKPGQLVTWKDVAGSGTRPHPHRQGSLFPHRRSPDRQRSLERRRRLAASGPMPPTLACKFTTGQLSVLRIVGDEVRRKGRCTMYLAEIAARAGVCRRLAQGALRAAERLGLVHIEERRVSAFRNLTNIVMVISAEWLTWLRLKRQGAKNFQARAKLVLEEEMRRATRAAKGSSEVRIAKSVPTTDHKT